MFKIIDLDIDDTLSADTRVSEVGMVYDPAIETQFVYFSKQQNNSPLTEVRDFAMNMFHVKQEKFESITDYPQYITDNALRAKNWVEENGYGSCMTPVGKARLNQLANREPISLETLKRMKAYADRHKKDLESSKSFEDGCGMLSWYSWGLDETGRVEKWLETQITKYEEMEYEPSLPDYVDYATGETDNMLIEDFIEKIPYEPKEEYLQRCIAYHIKNKGWDEDQSYAVCVKQMEEAFIRGDKVSFDYDDTLTTWKGKGLALHEKYAGSTLYIISARREKSGMLKVADELGIPHDRVFATGSNKAKIQKIKELRINKHYDNNEDVIDELGSIGIDFSCDCLEAFSMIGFIDGEPIFSTKEEAELYGKELHGCNGSHSHTDENGNEVYMACETHPMEDEYSFGIDEYSEEDIETIKLLKFLADTDYEKFEAVVGSLRGATEAEIFKRGHKKPVFYFKYDRVLSGAPDRDFCTSIENRFFRRFEIDLLQDTNREFGHKQQPYSKWLYKGGPNCVHAWRRYVYTPSEKNRSEQLKDLGMVSGKPGIPPKSMENNGYYSAETKRKSEIAYIISQQEMSKFQFKGDNEKRMVYSPLMLPNVLIPRVDEKRQKYFVRFTPQAIEKIQRKFMIEQRLRETNLEHSDHKFNDIVMVESWIITGEKDKAYELGFTKEQAPIGSWMAGYKVLDTEEGDVIWNDFIKTGKVRGFSVEGEFLLKFAKQSFSSDEELLKDVIDILSQVR